MVVLVIDDHPLIQDALAQLLRNSASRRSAGRNRCRGATAILDNEPDVALVLLTSRCPARGLDLLADLMQDYPGVPVVVLSATHDQATVKAALAAGARGFIPKTTDAQELLDAIRRCGTAATISPPTSRSSRMATASASLPAHSASRRGRPTC
jgi:DNA-binding NarL/FixJ family response regulator